MRWPHLWPCLWQHARGSSPSKMPLLLDSSPWSLLHTHARTHADDRESTEGRSLGPAGERAWRQSPPTEPRGRLSRPTEWRAGEAPSQEPFRAHECGCCDLAQDVPEGSHVEGVAPAGGTVRGAWPSRRWTWGGGEARRVCPGMHGQPPALASPSLLLSTTCSHLEILLHQSPEIGAN